MEKMNNQVFCEIELYILTQSNKYINTFLYNLLYVITFFSVKSKIIMPRLFKEEREWAISMLAAWGSKKEVDKQL